MLINEIKKKLEDKEQPKFLDSAHNRLINVLDKYGVDINSSFAELMTVYAGDIQGKDGFIINVAVDLEDFENSMTSLLQDEFDLPEYYIVLTNEELEYYIIYNKDKDSVYLIEYEDIKDFVKFGASSKFWNSFDSFIEWFLL